MFITYLEDRREQRETIYIYWTLEWFDDVWRSVQCPAASDPGIRNKAITYSYTIWDSVSLDTGFIATAVKFVSGLFI